MSQYYNPYRNSNWNYGGKNWTLSRGKIDLFLECPRCFYIDNKLGTKRPPGFPFSLNSAVDHLLKKEFDIYRARGSKHPLMEEYGLDVIPFKHPDIEKWRDSLKRGISFDDPQLGMIIRGGIDDVWVTPNGELIIVDYKATSKDGEVSLDALWQNSYKRQMEVYQWLFRKNDFKVSNTGYFVYVNGKTDVDAFDGKLEFDVKLIPYTGSDEWIEGTLENIKECLDAEILPEANNDCDYCTYRDVAREVITKNQKKSEKKESENPGTLF